MDVGNYREKDLIRGAVARAGWVDRIMKEKKDRADADLTTGPGTDDLSGGSPGQEWLPPDGLSQRQSLLATAYVDALDNFGMFDPGTGTEGACYSSNNPLSSKGISCAECVFFLGKNSCHLVSGEIAPEGLCKLWTIPNSDLVPTPEDEKPVVS